MTEMVERVANAIEAAMTDATGFERQRLIDGARAAIEAMREPTEGMVESGAPNTVFGANDTKYAAKWAWQDMIDEALK